MDTAIGRRLSSSPGALAAASAVWALVVAADVALIGCGHYPESLEARGSGP